MLMKCSTCKKEVDVEFVRSTTVRLPKGPGLRTTLFYECQICHAILEVEKKNSGAKMVPAPKGNG